MKTIQSIILLFIVGNLSAQIPNSGFETWTNMGTYENPDGWGTLNSSTDSTGVYTVTKGSPGSPGSSCIYITSKTAGTSVVGGIAVSGVLDSITKLPKSGFPYAIRSANFTGKWQHMIYGSSQGSIKVTLTRWDTGLNSRVTVATKTHTLSGMAMSWANFTIPLTYSDGGTPDTCIVVLKSSGTVPTNNDYLWVDNLGFSGLVSGTGIESSNLIINNVAVYPNPANENISVSFELKQSENVILQLIDITGQIVFTKNLGTVQGSKTETISASGLAKGTYFLKIKSDTKSQSNKIIIN